MKEENSLNCPECGTTLRDNSRFCFYCGLEVFQECPICGPQEIHPLRTLVSDGKLWCANRGQVLFNCVNCGRWLEPDLLYCQNPRCGGEVKPAYPASVGQDTTGNRELNRKRFPGEETLLARRFPKLWTPAPAGTYATIFAYGKLYDWKERGFEERTEDQGRVNIPLSSGIKPSFRCPSASRLMVIGSDAILATEREFVRVGLASNRGEDYWEEWGIPLTQAADLRHWLGWTERDGERILLWATLTKGATFVPQAVKIPESAALGKKGSLVLNSQYAYWTGTEGEVWSLELKTERVERLEAGGEVIALRTEETGVFCLVRETQNAPLKMTLEPLTPDALPETVSPGGVNFEGWCASERTVVLLSSQKAQVTSRPECSEFLSVQMPQGILHDWALWEKSGTGDSFLVTLTQSPGGSEPQLRQMNLNSGEIRPFYREGRTEVSVLGRTELRLALFAGELMIFSREGLQRLLLV